MSDMTKGEWFDFYKPIRNPVADESDAMDGCLFETYGSELEAVIAYPENQIWTYIEEDGTRSIVNGKWLVNRIGYLVTEKPWTEPKGHVSIFVCDDSDFENEENDEENDEENEDA